MVEQAQSKKHSTAWTAMVIAVLLLFGVGVMLWGMSGPAKAANKTQSFKLADAVPASRPAKKNDELLITSVGDSFVFNKTLSGGAGPQRVRLSGKKVVTAAPASLDPESQRLALGLRMMLSDPALAEKVGATPDQLARIKGLIKSQPTKVYRTGDPALPASPRVPGDGNVSEPAAQELAARARAMEMELGRRSVAEPRAVRTSGRRPAATQPTALPAVEAPVVEAHLAELRLAERAQRDAAITSILTPEQIERLKAAVDFRATTRPAAPSTAPAGDVPRGAAAPASN